MALPKAPAAPAKKATALAAVLGWLLSLAAARGISIDPDMVLQLDRQSLSTLSLRVVERLVVTLSRPLVSGAAALMEVLSRVLLLLLALVLCAAPSHREAILQRARSVLRGHVEVAVRCALRTPPLPSLPRHHQLLHSPCADYRCACRQRWCHRKRSPSCRPALRQTCW